MLNLLRAWAGAVFADPKVRFAFWGLVAVALGVGIPDVPQSELSTRGVFLLGLVNGVLIPWVADFARRQQAAPNMVAYDKLMQATQNPKSRDAEKW